MKIVLDEGVPEGLSEHLPEHEIHSVRSLGWKSVVNGKLLALLETVEPDAFITADKNMQRQQNLLNQPFMTLLLSTNYWEEVRRNVGALREALENPQAGEVRQVECGRFIPKRFRPPAP